MFKINKSLQLFLLKAAGLLALWFGMYHFVLKPLRFPDKQLTHFITILCAKALNLITNPITPYYWADGLHPNFPSSCIMQQNSDVFHIYDACNGLEIMMIYVGLIILIPNNLKRKLVFIAVGLFLLTLANVVRCVALFLVYKHYPRFFEFNHHYTFTLFMYVLIFIGWVLFTKNLKANAT